MMAAKGVVRVLALAWVLAGVGCSESGASVPRDGRQVDLGADGAPDGQTPVPDAVPAPASAIPSGGQPGTVVVPSAGAPAPAPVPPGEDCGSISVEPMVTYGEGNLLIVFDRSMSMATAFQGAGNRLEAAQEAIKAALAPLVCEANTNPDGTECVDRISAALLTFPTYDTTAGTGIDTLSCMVEDVSNPEQMDWQPVSDFYRNFDPYWAARPLNSGDPMWSGMYPLQFGTPISIAFAQADQALMNPALTGNKAVLFLTDGEEIGPCAGGLNAGLAAQNWWQQSQIPTYVVSLAPPGPGQIFNDLVAQSGGTGSVINPADGASLTAEIQKIVMDTIGQASCEIIIQDAKLLDPLQACEKGDVFVGPTKVPCDQEARVNGFFVKNENTIEVVGDFCDQLLRDMSIDATFPCAVFAPL